MPITILCAADLWGSKVNYELQFPTMPTSADLQQKVENVFAPEHAARRPADVPPTQGFDIDRMQTFDERAQQWVDLLTPAQLQDYSQVYLFQKENEFHKEVQSKIPPPVPAPITRALALASTPKMTSPDAYSSVTQMAPPPQPPTYATVTQPRTVEYAATGFTPGLATAPAAAAIEGRTIPFVEKQRMVFDEMDSKKTRVAELEDFRAIFARLRIDYPTVTPQELFAKADANADNLISYDEWKAFTELYPTLLDSLYFRTKDFHTDASQQQSIEISKMRLDELRSKEKEARMASMQSQAESAGQEQKLASQIASAQEAQLREKDAKTVLEAAHDDTERGREELRSRIIEQNQQKDKERQKQVELMESSRNVEVVQRKLQTQETEQAKAEEVLLEMERRVAEQRREVERNHGAVDKIRGELASAQGAEHLANIVLGEAQKDTQTCNDRVAMAEAEVTARQEREREATACHRESQNDTARQLAKRDMEERELQNLKEKESQKLVLEDEAVRSVEEQEKLTQTMEHENMELNVNRRQVEEEERPLLEQELKLREMRDALEENEARLRTDHRTFHSTHGRGGTAADTTASPLRASPTRAASRSPYTSGIIGTPGNSSTLPRPIITQPVVPAYLPSSSPVSAYPGYEAAPALSMIPPPRGMSPAGNRGL
eukprot:TRINITY_DN27479_c0_g1_i1.p1 TRINITY_DN27479_c0_g1~~TRINITY_DN27479_c0_g1_i1.p1  ORF type:complete len:664 (+),score=189.47 TRINITY_DN27479_c0_g1_i1:43-2034(+)